MLDAPRLLRAAQRWVARAVEGDAVVADVLLDLIPRLRQLVRGRVRDRVRLGLGLGLGLGSGFGLGLGCG